MIGLVVELVGFGVLFDSGNCRFDVCRLLGIAELILRFVGCELCTFEGVVMYFQIGLGFGGITRVFRLRVGWRGIVVWPDKTVNRGGLEYSLLI